MGKALRIEDIVSEVRSQLGDNSIEAIYRDKVLKQRTRQYDLRASPNNPTVEILHTLLGIELKVGNRRLLCPDLPTARYLAVFARVGCDRVAVPYDITQISRIADDLESSWYRLLLLIDRYTADRSPRLRAMVRRRLLNDLREAISRLGAGTRFPKFDQRTRQRPDRPPGPTSRKRK